MVKVERSSPAPKSLEIEKQKSNGSYNKSDVVERLAKDFIINVIFVKSINYRIRKLNI